MPNNRLCVAIIGGGIGGLSAGNALIRRGLDVTVFEQVDTLREIGTGLSLFPNGRRQLERMGLKGALAQVGAKIGDVSVYRMDLVGPIPTTDSSGWNGVYGMHRADLSQTLADALPPTVIRTAHRCNGFEQNARAAQLTFANGTIVEADVSADGYPVIPAKVCRPTVDTGIFRLSCVSRFGSEGEGPGLGERGAPNLDGRWQALYGVPCSAW